ncbi:MAG: phage tail protein [Finegoldia sp.]|nr:phage tail protein [Finegoldia sp.]
MAGDLGKAYVQIVPSAKGISGSISSVLNGESVSAGKSSGSLIGSGIVSTVKKAVVALGIGKLISQSITAGGELEQSLGGIKKLFGNAFDQVTNNAKNAYKTVGISANEYMQNVTSFSASLINSLGGDTSKAASVADMAMRDMADNVNAFGTDMESVQMAYQSFARGQYQLLDNLKLGYSGTKSEMERLLADAEKITGVKYDINNLSDVYEAIHVIQDNLHLTGTSAKEAETTLQGSFASMKAAAQDFAGALALGMDLGPSIQALATTIPNFLIGNLFPMIGNIILQLPSALVTFITQCGNEIGTMLSESINLEDLKSKLPENMGPVIDGLKGMFEDIKPIFDDLKGKVSEAVGFISDALSKLDFSGIKALLDNILPALSDGFGVFIDIAGPAIEGVVQAFTNLWNAIQPLVAIIAEHLSPIFQILSSFLGGVFKGVLIGVSATFDLLRIAIEFLTPIIDAVLNAFSFFQPVLSLVAEWVGVAIGLFVNLGTAGTNLKDIIVNGWNNMKNTIMTVKDGISGAINVIKEHFTTLSSKGTSLKNALSTAWNGIKTAISNAGSNIGSKIESIKTFFNNLKSNGQGLFSKMKEVWGNIVSTISNAKSKIQGVIDNIKRIFDGLRNINLASAGRAIIDSFLDGLKAAFESVKDFISWIAEWIAEHKGPISYDRKLLIPAGNAMMEGLYQGLQDGFNGVKSLVNSMNDEIARGFGANAIESEIALNPKVNNLAYAGAYIPSVSESPSDNPIYINLVNEMDGREISRLTYKYDQEFMEKETKFRNRRNGGV